MMQMSPDLAWIDNMTINICELYSMGYDELMALISFMYIQLFEDEDEDEAALDDLNMAYSEAQCRGITFEEGDMIDYLQSMFGI